MTGTLLIRSLMIGAALSGGAATSASAQVVRSEFVPCGVSIFASDAPSIFARCDIATDTPKPIIVGTFSGRPPGVLAFEVVVDCYNNPQMSNPPIVRSSGLTLGPTTLGCQADAPFMDNPRISVASTHPNTTFTFGD